jgi:hypothetical protein
MEGGVQRGDEKIEKEREKKEKENERERGREEKRVRIARIKVMKREGIRDRMMLMGRGQIRVTGHWKETKDV